MIFVTVGHQTPFDRLVRLVDDWAGRSGASVFGQIGASQYRPRNMLVTDFLDTREFDRRLSEATAVVSHAGTGTIIQALLRQKPILLLPRLASKGETRNDHQIGTARYFEQAGQVLAAYDDSDFLRLLDGLDKAPTGQSVSHTASGPLMDRLRRFIDETPSRTSYG